jgi:putative membrane protein
MTSYLVTFPAFVEWLGTALALTAVFLTIYVWTTPSREFSLILGGNVSAAITLSGALLGYVLPLASVLIHGTTFIDFCIWSVIAMAVQVMLHLVMRLLIRDLETHLVADQRAIAILVGSVSVAVGLLNAAAMAG